MNPLTPEEVKDLEFRNQVDGEYACLTPREIKRVFETIRDRERERDEIAELAGKVFKILDGAGIEHKHTSPTTAEYLGPDQIAERLIAERDELQRKLEEAWTEAKNAGDCIGISAENLPALICGIGDKASEIQDKLTAYQKLAAREGEGGTE